MGTMKRRMGIEVLEAAQVDVKLTIDRVRRVTPAAPTPNTCLYLSNLDDMIGSRFFTPTVYFYPPPKDAADDKQRTIKAMRKALSKVLVYYYPLAGRLRDAGGGKLLVECGGGTDNWALFVEASSHMKLSDLGPFHSPNPSWKPLIYNDHNSLLSSPLVIVQVTKFGCGGVAVGLRICHCMCDGMGAMQFVNAWTEMARGREAPTVMPTWGREALRPRSPPSIQYPHIEFDSIQDRSNFSEVMNGVEVEQKSVWFSREYLDWLKMRMEEESGGSLRCTAFDALAGLMWRTWIGAVRVEPAQQEMRLSFAANARPLLGESLSDGFYGNAIGIACAMSTAGELAARPLWHAAMLVQAARMAITKEYIMSTIDYLEVQRPQSLEFSAKLGITQWTRFSLYDTDFGCGRPCYAGPIDLSPTPQLCVFLPHPKHPHSVIVSLCLPRSALSSFSRLLLQQSPLHAFRFNLF